MTSDPPLGARVVRTAVVTAAGWVCFVLWTSWFAAESRLLGVYYWEYVVRHAYTWVREVYGPVAGILALFCCP